MLFLICLQRRTQVYDPLGYSHICDNAASYHPKKKSQIDKHAAVNQWVGVTDMTGRGFASKVSPFDYSVAKQQVTACTLDANNRYFLDNKRIFETYGTILPKPAETPAKSSPKRSRPASANTSQFSIS